jgi:hypothetical protein
METLWRLIDEGVLMSISLTLSRLTQAGDIFHPLIVSSIEELY